MKLMYWFHKTFGEKYLGDLGFDFKGKPSRIEIVQKIIDIKKYKNYLEIGTFNNELFNSIKCENKIGVDPERGGTHRETSDNFFLKNTKNFDCVFIDGLHHYKQVKKDIQNSLKFLNPNGIILLHDCLPSNYFLQAIPRCQWEWNGDVWKALVEFRSNNSCDTYTCYADQGIGIILKRKNKNPLEIEIKDFSKMKFNTFFKNHKTLMNIIDYENLLKII